MNTDQIAAEAASECSSHAYDVYRISGKDTHPKFKAIIKSAIEKAYHEGFVNGARNTYDEIDRTRAAHASNFAGSVVVPSVFPAAQATPATPERSDAGRESEPWTVDKWYVGSMNDGLFIINTPPRPSTDDVWHERPDGPTMVLAVSGLTNEQATAIADAHNASIPTRQNESGFRGDKFKPSWKDEPQQGNPAPTLEEQEDMEYIVPEDFAHDPIKCGCENHAEYCPYNPARIRHGEPSVGAPTTRMLVSEHYAKLNEQSDDTRRLEELENEISNLRHDYEIVSSERNREKARMNELESRVFTNREGEHQLNIDFTLPTLREAIDAAMSQTKEKE